MRHCFSNCVMCLVLVLVALAEHADAQLQQLALKVPSSANALVVVNAKALHAHTSEIGDDWEGAGMTVPLANVQWYVQAGEMDYEYMQPLWEISLAAMPQAPTMEQVAADFGGRLDRLAGSQAVERPNDSYVVAFGPRVLGAMSPANRQNVIRWVRASKVKKTVDLAPYLAKAMAVAEEGPAQMLLAFDLNGVLAPAEVAQALTKSQALRDADVDPNAAASLLGGILGMRLDIQWDRSIHGRLLIEFQEQPDLLVKVAQPLLLEILAKRGVHVGALANWNVSGRTNAIVLEGEMSLNGLRRVASILAGPTGPWSSSTTTSTSQATSPESATGLASQQYFQAVTGYLDDLFGGQIQPQNLYQVNVWVERYARKIEDLNQQDVDPDVLSYADNVVMLLREISSSIGQSQLRTNIREATMDGPGSSRYVRYGAYGYYEKPYVARDRALVQADEASQSLAATQQIVAELHQLSNETRRAMSERYDLQF